MITELHPVIEAILLAADKPLSYGYQGYGKKSHLKIRKHYYNHSLLLLINSLLRVVKLRLLGA